MNDCAGRANFQAMQTSSDLVASEPHTDADVGHAIWTELFWATVDGLASASTSGYLFDSAER